jgi:hypothetical protein
VPFKEFRLETDSLEFEVLAEVTLEAMSVLFLVNTPGTVKKVSKKAYLEYFSCDIRLCSKREG